MVFQSVCPPTHGKVLLAPGGAPPAPGGAPHAPGGVPLAPDGAPLAPGGAPFAPGEAPPPPCGTLKSKALLTFLHCSLLYLTYTQVHAESAISLEGSGNAPK